MYLRILSLVAGLCAWAALSLPASAERLILQSPTISRTEIAFVYGGDIWAVSRSGGAAHRVLSGYGLASDPYFSPDGTKIAFSANYDGNVDVYTVPASGGEPTRLTYHPAPDAVIGWTPDGKNILFRSSRRAMNDAEQIYSIPADGGEATMLPLPDAQVGSYSPDDSHFAYVPNGQWEPYWQNYRGGQTTPIWIASMSDSSVTPVPRENSNDRDPMWIGHTIYFLSDRDGPFTLFSYEPGSRTVKRLLPSGGFGIVAASANGSDIVYSTFDAIHVYDTATGADRAVNVSISADLPDVRPHWMPAGYSIANADISPTGVRAVFESHGDIFTVPAENGDVRNLTATPGVMERSPYQRSARPQARAQDPTRTAQFVLLRAVVVTRQQAHRVRR
jgi:tricorn protease